MDGLMGAGFVESPETAAGLTGAVGAASTGIAAPGVLTPTVHLPGELATAPEPVAHRLHMSAGDAPQR
jgi:hypothetical protein